MPGKFTPPIGSLKNFAEPLRDLPIETMCETMWQEALAQLRKDADTPSEMDIAIKLAARVLKQDPNIEPSWNRPSLR